jgi:hypothetical protein
MLKNNSDSGGRPWISIQHIKRQFCKGPFIDIYVQSGFYLVCSFGVQLNTCSLFLSGQQPMLYRQTSCVSILDLQCFMNVYCDISDPYVSIVGIRCYKFHRSH